MQPNPWGEGAFGRQRGIALFVGLVFLVMLTLVALIVMKGTLLEMRMTTATARHEQAFESSETARTIPEAILAAHVFNRGWPESWGGDKSDSLFDLDTIFANRTVWGNLLNPNTTSNQGLQNSCGGSGLVIFYMALSPCSTQTAAYKYTPSKWLTSVSFNVCTDGSAGCTTRISIIRDGVTLKQGSGAAQAQGYASVGVGTPRGGSALLLQVRSAATVPGNGQAVTIAQYKLNITN